VSGERAILTPTPHLRIEGLSKRFGSVPAVDDLSLDIPRGDLLALLGPSGSGKTTTLRLLAGFETPDSGRILVDGEDVARLTPAVRRFGMVFQHYALFPHLDVGQNVGFGLESQGLPAAERSRRIADALAMVELAGLERRAVGALSGGQQQRVALARALAPAPRILLLDEPLSNLDPSLRERTRRELRALIERIGITTILVTHEQEEAFDLAAHVALLQRGRLEQVGTPEALYGSPRTPFVAGFIGRASPLTVRVMTHDARVARVVFPGDPGGAEVQWEIPQPEPLEGGPSVLYVRPEAVQLVEPDPTRLSGEVALRRFLGAAALYTVRLANGESVEVLADPDAAQPGDRAGLLPVGGGSGLHLFGGEQGRSDDQAAGR
jgi:ABC-type Fe3+/spermidine/putrescine transport system ATPase subunit